METYHNTSYRTKHNVETLHGNITQKHDITCNNIYDNLAEPISIIIIET